jgi:hypothetical protein
MVEVPHLAKPRLAKSRRNCGSPVTFLSCTILSIGGRVTFLGRPSLVRLHSFLGRLSRERMDAFLGCFAGLSSMALKVWIAFVEFVKDW